MKVELNNNFDEIISSNAKVLVDFYADWCGPCKMMAPMVAELAGEYDGELKVGKLNVDENPEIAQKYSVMSIPMFAFIKGGELVETIIGAQSRSKLESVIEKITA